jgi:hypothetical protein
VCVTQINTGRHRPSAKKTSKGYCVELGFSVWCIHSKHGKVLAAKRIRVRCEKGKPVVRRGRKAQGPPMYGR